MRAALTLAGLALALGAITGCGSDGSDAGSSPTDASVEDFCANFETVNSDLLAVEDTEDMAEVVTILQDGAANMTETGTPEDIPDDARAGLVATIDAINDLDDDATEDEILNLDEELSDTEQSNSDALDDYLEKTCELS